MCAGPVPWAPTSASVVESATSASPPPRFRRPLQFNPEDAAFPERAFDAYLAPHQVDQSLAHHQADAGAFFGFGFLSETVEGLEKMR